MAKNNKIKKPHVLQPLARGKLKTRLLTFLKSKWQNRKYPKTKEEYLVFRKEILPYIINSNLNYNRKQIQEILYELLPTEYEDFIKLMDLAKTNDQNIRQSAVASQGLSKRTNRTAITFFKDSIQSNLAQRVVSAIQIPLSSALSPEIRQEISEIAKTFSNNRIYQVTDVRDSNGTETIDIRKKKENGAEELFMHSTIDEGSIVCNFPKDIPTPEELQAILQVALKTKPGELFVTNNPPKYKENFDAAIAALQGSNDPEIRKAALTVKIKAVDNLDLATPKTRTNRPM